MYLINYLVNQICGWCVQSEGVAVIRPMELDLKCLKTTDWNKTYGIGPINEVEIRPTDT